MAAASKQFEVNGESKEIILGKKIAELKKRLILAGKIISFLLASKTVPSVAGNLSLSLSVFIIIINVLSFVISYIDFQRVKRKQRKKNGMAKKRKHATQFPHWRKK